LEEGRGVSADWPQLFTKLKLLENNIIVDTSASGDLIAQYAPALSAGISIVAANKKGSSGPQKDYDLFASLTSNAVGPKLYIECNVGAGLPVISSLKGLIAAGDQVVTVEAVLSGTLSFIFNTFNAERSFSSVVRLAKQKGYTEPDPRDDLSGADVARKILILSRIAGLKMEMADVKIVPLLSAKVSAASSVDEFFTLLEAEDAEYEAIRAKAASEGKALRFVAKLDMETKVASISLMAVDNSHPMFPLQGADNIIVYKTRYYSERPMVIIGPGAGAAVTAGGVFSDIILCSMGQ
jgi:aspartokinase/homoserine dehydrogenase 1